jgi:mannosyltransferase OCH1-like enzyme
VPVVGLQVRFYSDDAALTFVRREFPEYFEAYLNLPRDVERADFFR